MVVYKLKCRYNYSSLGWKFKDIFLILLIIHCSTFIGVIKAEQSDKYNCARLISLAPSITETLYHIGLGNNLVGVTKFCKYPTIVELLPKIGGLLDPNLEAIISLRPTLVVVLEEQREIANRLNKLGIRTLAIEHRNISGILNSIEEISAKCQRDSIGEVKAIELRQEIGSIVEAIKNRYKPRVMIVVGRTGGSSTAEGVFVSGSDGFYNDLVKLAGGINVNQSTTASFPILSREGIITVDPEVIIEIIMNPPGNTRVLKDAIINQWKSIPYLSAVKNQRITVLDSDYASLPGPRFVKLLSDMVKAIHPTKE